LEKVSGSVLDAIAVPVVLAVAANATTVVDAFVGVAIAVEEATGLRILLLIVLPPTRLNA